jgi:hypothetical protein
MNFDQNLKAFLRDLPLSKMSGHQKFLAVAALQSGGKTKLQIATIGVKSKWRKSLLGICYNPAFYDRAQQEGWVDPLPGKKGAFAVTQDGLEHLGGLSPLHETLNAGELNQTGRLIIVNRKATHSFDKFLRRIFAEAKTQVSVADSWVDETVFDNVLDVIPKSVPVRLVYAQARGTFEQRAKRFGIEYQKFSIRNYKALHDRFIIVDEMGYVLGPSIKDAASNSPALVVELGGKERRSLQTFFDELWKKGKTRG